METLEDQVEESIMDKIGAACEAGLGAYMAFAGGALMFLDPVGTGYRIKHERDYYRRSIDGTNTDDEYTPPINTIGSVGMELMFEGIELTDDIGLLPAGVGAFGTGIGPFIASIATGIPELAIIPYVLTATIDGIYNSARLAYKTIKERTDKHRQPTE